MSGQRVSDKIEQIEQMHFSLFQRSTLVSPPLCIEELKDRSRTPVWLDIIDSFRKPCELDGRPLKRFGPQPEEHVGLRRRDVGSVLNACFPRKRFSNRQAERDAERIGRRPLRPQGSVFFVGWTVWLCAAGDMESLPILVQTPPSHVRSRRVPGVEEIDFEVNWLVVHFVVEAIAPCEGSCLFGATVRCSRFQQLEAPDWDYQHNF